MAEFGLTLDDVVGAVERLWARQREIAEAAEALPDPTTLADRVAQCLATGEDLHVTPAEYRELLRLYRWPADETKLRTALGSLERPDSVRVIIDRPGP